MPCKYLEIEADGVRSFPESANDVRGSFPESADDVRGSFPESADDVAHVSTQTLFHEELLGSAQRLLSKKLLASVASSIDLS